MTSTVDIVVPVYKGGEETRRCLESVLASRQRTPCEVVVVDDCSPDPELSRYVEALSRDGRVTLLRNEENTGFVRAVNRAMALHDDRDVVLLNSDTEVANDWLDRLRSAAYASPRVATVTPFSNNATICSYPFEGWQEGLPGGLGLARLDRLVAETNAGRILDLPTGVGFCMFVRREALREFGLFDAERYGRGYGEENDFSMRAAKAGWRNLLACDVFVYHEGSVSFSGERSQRVRTATVALLEVHPEYVERVREFLRADPADEMRRAIDRARAAVSPEEARRVIDERGREREALLARLHEAERYAADRGAHALEVHEALARVTALSHERLARIEELDRGLEHARAELGREIEHLRRSLAETDAARAEAQAQLDRIRATWPFRLYRGLKRLRSRMGAGDRQTEA